MTLDRAGALASVPDVVPTAPPFEVVFAAERSCVRIARRMAIHYLTVHRLDTALFEDVAVVVSELVTNAVEYGRGAAVGLRLRCHDGELRVEVRDNNPAPAILRTPTDDDESGRGLWLVAVLARDWGVSSDGRMTWCTFRIRGGRGS
ncbi:ATP-binding protein [Streptomyces sp. NPDC046860]|uniref:ATP-binding protein n=1 Tax=Streptomyces sp. NPDC046860 TaxID=3154495 RepID=UPI003405097C